MSLRNLLWLPLLATALAAPAFAIAVDEFTVGDFDTNVNFSQTTLDPSILGGSLHVTFDAGTLPSGVYFYTLQANGQSQTRKMLLVK